MSSTCSDLVFSTAKLYKCLGEHGNTPRQMEVEHPSFHREDCSCKDDACVRFKASYLEGEGERESAQAS